jgi:diguanylate cyclase (GGDEF)-like protein
VREDDVVARTGGDEFVVLARGVSSEATRELADRIAVAIGVPFRVTAAGATVEVDIGISIGTARSAAPLTDAVLARADEAMLADKARRHRPARSRAHARA